MPVTKEQELGQQGTALWAFKRMKEDLLPSLFEDLNQSVDDGLREEQCDLVKEVLRILVAASTTGIQNSSTSPSITEIWEVLDELREMYFRWNDEAQTAQERKAILSEMKQLKDKISRKTRLSYVEIENGVNKSDMVSVYQASAQITTSYPQTFVNLTKAVEKFQKANSKF
jgi:hypothetical protein